MHVYTHAYLDTVLYNTPQKRELRLRKEICKLPELEPRLPGMTACIPLWVLSRGWSYQITTQEKCLGDRVLLLLETSKAFFQLLLLSSPSLSSGWHLCPGIAQLSSGSSWVSCWLSQMKWKLKRASGLQAQASFIPNENLPWSWAQVPMNFFPPLNFVEGFYTIPCLESWYWT